MMEPTIIRVKKERGFTMISNKLIRDERLSWKAKGIMTYLLSLPDDWKIHKAELLQHASDGKDSLSAGLQELIKYGYVSRVQVRDNGRICGVTYYVYEDPVDNLEYGLPETDFPHVGTPPLLILNNTNTNNTNTNTNTNTNITKTEKNNNKLITELRSAEQSSERRLTRNEYIKLVDRLPSELCEYIKKENEDLYIVDGNFNENYKAWLLWNNPVEDLFDFGENKDTKADTDCSRNPSRDTVLAHHEVENEKSSNLSSEDKMNQQQLFSSLGMVRGSDYVPDHKPSKKTKKNSAPKESSDSQKIKEHFLDNRKKLFENGKVPTPLSSVRSPVINKRIKDILDQGITVDQFIKVLDFAMENEFVVNTLHYELQPMLSDGVFMKMYSDPSCNVIEKPVVQHKPKKMIPVCPKCGERMNGFGRCSFCDE